MRYIVREIRVKMKWLYALSIGYMWEQHTDIWNILSCQCYNFTHLYLSIHDRYPYPDYARSPGCSNCPKRGNIEMILWNSFVYKMKLIFRDVLKLTLRPHLLKWNFNVFSSSLNLSSIVICLFSHHIW
jgi:hypothetical protein